MKEETFMYGGLTFEQWMLRLFQYGKANKAPSEFYYVLGHACFIKYNIKITK